MTVRSVNVFGATGSIGQSTLDVVRAHPDKFKINLLTAQSNVERLAAQAIEFQPSHVVIGDEAHYSALKDALSAHPDTKISAGEAALVEGAQDIKADITMAAIVGMAGLAPLMASIAHGGLIAIANKEPLVAAGAQVISAAEQSGATLLPIDSEHNAIFQVFEPKNKAAVERLILTASGGPFRDWSLDKIKSATPEQAINHPNWEMGAKISVDSASMMNKALEIIEAHYLFDMPASKIDVLVHPQSLIHSMVEYSDGSILSQMGASDMRTPITNIMGWPERIKTPGARLDLSALTQMTFEPVDHARFPAINMAYEALKSGQGACLAMNAANEVAVSAFLSHKIAFMDMHDITMRTLEKRQKADLNSLNEIITYDKLCRDLAESFIRKT